VPAIYDARELTEDGGLMGYRCNFAAANLLAGAYVGRILKGARLAIFRSGSPPVRVCNQSQHRKNAWG
jgi:hypothetical protein